ncbi:hypothetical protein BDP81DRAFT_508567 [Colletotrichum phormii]|uniref:Uncharacterized protein n=1 Tax=Colletotrichum phormii TaxID=359342 RepID=A0AAI9ZCX1_9PEZI|nr:uncharacterized protein BDP81DRAFT_508567 [Colletotrichum phormii]KAK1622212.1 hypothetical protein BDP81DRAFT_508567 [Colletotrichum phormii]
MSRWMLKGFSQRSRKAKSAAHIKPILILFRQYQRQAPSNPEALREPHYGAVRADSKVSFKVRQRPEVFTPRTLPAPATPNLQQLHDISVSSMGHEPTSSTLLPLSPAAGEASDKVSFAVDKKPPSARIISLPNEIHDLIASNLYLAYSICFDLTSSVNRSLEWSDEVCRLGPGSWARLLLLQASNLEGVFIYTQSYLPIARQLKEKLTFLTIRRDMGIPTMLICERSPHFPQYGGAIYRERFDNSILSPADSIFDLYNIAFSSLSRHCGGIEEIQHVKHLHTVDDYLDKWPLFTLALVLKRLRLGVSCLKYWEEDWPSYAMQNINTKGIWRNLGRCESLEVLRIDCPSEQFRPPLGRDLTRERQTGIVAADHLTMPVSFRLPGLVLHRYWFEPYGPGGDEVSISLYWLILRKE